MQLAIKILLIVFLYIPAITSGESCEGPNTRPTADAGFDQDIALGGAVFLRGIASDTDSDLIVSWAWKMLSKPPGSRATLQFPNTPRPSFIPDVIGLYVVSLVVSDGCADSEADRVFISVRESEIPSTEDRLW